MACLSPRNLTIAICLVLQAMASPCMPCACKQGKHENHRHEQVFATSSEAVDNANTCCSVCEAGTKTRLSQRIRMTDRQFRQLAATTWNHVVLDDDTVVFGGAVFFNDALPSPDVHELQVFLE